jgi:hypothetical protein
MWLAARMIVRGVDGRPLHLDSPAVRYQAINPHRTGAGAPMVLGMSDSNVLLWSLAD